MAQAYDADTVDGRIANISANTADVDNGVWAEIGTAWATSRTLHTLVSKQTGECYIDYSTA